jgi:hypothetical protein
VVSNRATAVKGAWSEAEGVYRSEAETLDGRGSGVARLAVGGGGRFECFVRAERAGGCRVGGRVECGDETAGGRSPPRGGGFCYVWIFFFLRLEG